MPPSVFSLTAPFASLFFCLSEVGPIGLKRAPATQQFSRSAPRIKKLPLHPKVSKRNWFKGARVQSMTGLPAMASPFAMGRLFRKYFPMMITEGWRFRARPSPVMNPAQMYSWKMLVQNAAETIPTPHSSPPNMTTGRLPKRFTKILLRGPPPYVAANIIEETHAISPYDASKKSWISLKKIAIPFGKAYENPMEMNAPKTTAHPHWPSGGV
uniref:Uncharacterized protein n=1 Tax=Micrurus surinamensis TaxID=129470 RepID=A0A2D4Q471_MICSU